MLGAGSFGITYLAFDHKLDGPVALKEYFPAGLAARADDRRVGASSTENREVFAWGLDRFIEEARAIHQFRHPNVVRAHRYLEAHGTAYIVMEYVEGESLAAVLDSRGSLAAAEWRPWLDRLLDGLAHIHGNGYLHRDIKPGNIVIRSADGEPVLIDFGAARVAARERTHTRVLTPEYAPIEQHSSQAMQEPPTDIYALAAVSYRALTGAPPPEAPDRMLDDRYEPLVGRVAGGEREWLAAIDRGLALRPQDRPQTVAAWNVALRGVDGTLTPDIDSSVPGRPDESHEDDSSARDRGKRASRRLVAAVAAAIVAFAWLWQSVPPDSAPRAHPSARRSVAAPADPAERPPHLADPGIDSAPSEKLSRTSDKEPIEAAPAPPPYSYIVNGTTYRSNLSPDQVQEKLRQFREVAGQTSAAYFTRGSHQDDVLRVQGTPDGINRYAASGYEVWRYGRSSVNISTRSQQVTEWSNSGRNLNVRLEPGSNTTSAAYFTRGSHQDDVLRVQGTPDGINRYAASGYEVWRYGRSSVNISTRSQQVTEWSNSGRNLKVRLNPGADR